MAAALAPVRRPDDPARSRGEDVVSRSSRRSPAALPAGTELIFSRPTEGIAVYVDIAFMAGLVLAAPFIMYQVWLFVAPALYAHEKRFVTRLSSSSLSLRC